MRRLAPLILVLALVCAMPSVASATFTWSTTKTAVDTSNAFTTTVACPTATLCVIGGAHDHIGVSTNPTGGATAWTDGPVGTLAGGSSGYPTINAISCPSASLCAAVDDQNHLLWSTNPAGGASTWQYGTLPVQQPGNVAVSLGSIACQTVSSCVGTQSNGSPALAGPPTVPSSWAPVSGSTGANAACTTGLCALAAGTSVYTAGGPGGSYTATSGIAPYNGSSYQDTLGTVACGIGFCIGGGGNGYLFWSASPTGGTSQWHNASLTSSLSGSTCTQTGGPLCAMWTQFGSFVWMSTNPTGGPTAWSVYQDVANGGVQNGGDQTAGVSCPSASFCVAATAKGYVVTGDDGSTGSGGSGGTGGSGGSGSGGSGSGSGGSGSGGSTGSGTGSSGSGSAGSGSGSSGIIQPTGTGTTGPAVTPIQVTLERQSYGTDAIGFFLQVSAAASGTLIGQTDNSYAFTGSVHGAAAAKRKVKKARILLGSVKLSLAAHKTTKVTLKLSRRFRRFAASHRVVRIRITVTLKNEATGKTTVVTRKLTYRAPSPKRKHK